MVDIVVATIAAVQAVLIAWLGLRVKAVGRDASAARAQLEPNHGSSSKDQLTRLEQAITRLDHKLNTDWHRIGALERHFEDHIKQCATFMRLLTKEKK